MKSLTKILFALLMITGMSKAYAITEDRHLSGFNAVDLGGSFDVKLTQGATESVKVEAPQDIMDRIKTEVQGGILKIYNKGNSNWNFSMFGNHKKVIIYVVIKDVTSLDVSGSGDISFRDGISANILKLRVSGSGDMAGKVDAKDLEVSVSGSGDVKLTGRAVTSSVRVSGSGDFSGGELVTNSTTVRVGGSGNAHVNANDRIDASVSGSGDIYCAGSAKNVSTSKSGSGDIHRH